MLNLSEVPAPAPAPYPHGQTTDLQSAAGTRVISAMHEHLYDPLSLQDMADIAHYSPFHFNRLFRKITGIPPNHFLYALRLSRAKRLLEETDLNVTDICFEVVLGTTPNPTGPNHLIGALKCDRKLVLATWLFHLLV